MPSLMVSTGAEPTALTDLLKFEVNPTFCRDTYTYEAPSGAALAITIGTILGASAALSIAFAVNAGNTGDGVLGSLVLKADAQAGVYALECITAAANGGVFSVIDPKNDRLADLSVAVAYDNGEFGCTLADGATDFVVGDGFTVTVTEVAGLMVPLDLTAVDGAQNVAGISAANFTIADGVSGVRGLVLDRGPATIVRDLLTYPAGASTAQKAAIDAQIKALGFKIFDAV